MLGLTRITQSVLRLLVKSLSALLTLRFARKSVGLPYAFICSSQWDCAGILTVYCQRNALCWHKE